MMTDALDVGNTTVEGPLAQDGQDGYALQGPDNGQVLTPEYLCRSPAVRDAQRCDLDESKAIQGWLTAIGVSVRISRLSSE